MISLGVLDYWIFFFNPLQKNMFLDQTMPNNDQLPKAIVGSVDGYDQTSTLIDYYDLS